MKEQEVCVYATGCEAGANGNENEKEQQKPRITLNLFRQQGTEETPIKRGEEKRCNSPGRSNYFRRIDSHEEAGREEPGKERT